MAEPDRSVDPKPDGARRKAATIEDVATIAGVSIATVSRALRMPDKVAESTRQKVNAAIARTGYTANAMARNLRLQKSQMVLALASSISDPNIIGILSGIERAANARRHGVLIGNTEGELAIEADYLQFVSAGMADGVILLTGRAPVGPDGKPLPRDLPVVAAMRPIASADVSYVGVDDVEAGIVAADYLLSLGHRRIVYVTGPVGEIVSDLRHEGFLRATAATGESWTIEGNGTSEGGKAAVERCFIRDTMPTAFFCFNDDTAIGVIAAIRARGLSVPHDFSVLGFDDIPYVNYFDPSLTTVRQPRRQIGELAMDMLLDKVRNRSAAVEQRLLHADLIVRDSCGPVPLGVRHAG